MSAAIAATSYSANVALVIDMTYKGTTFAMFSATSFDSSAALAASASSLLTQFASIVPRLDKRYIIESVYACTTTVGGSGPTGSLKIDRIIVEQVTPLRNHIDPAAAVGTLKWY